ncbi:MAG: aromatic amino acid transport family protein [Chlamydiales bacterium]|nr:aromatic amino acid transport family protein [Chlamydiales bacterium]
MNSRLFGGILLVTGTAVGAGMLALPVLTAMAGFYPSILLFTAIWLGTIFTAFLVMEVNLWFDHEVNLISMAKYTLGKYGAMITWVLFLLLLYSLTSAYLAGSGLIMSKVAMQLFGVTLPFYVEPLPLVLLFALFVYCGTRPVDYLNRIFMIGLVVAYFGLIIWALPDVKLNLLSVVEPSFLWGAVPVVVTSFGFHIIIPVLTDYLKRDVKSIKKAIIIGSLVPLVIYVIWELVILGIVPLEGDMGLVSTLKRGSMATESLAEILKNDWITTFAESFSIFALLTSFLGVSLSLSSFLRDGFNIKQSGSGKFFVVCLTFIPPLIFVFLFPRGFILALQYAGIIVAVLSGILPALMAWKGRLMKKEVVLYKTRGGYTSLILAIFFSLIVIGLEIAEKLDWIKV